LAKRKGWPLLLHIEFGYIGQRKAIFAEALERLLKTLERLERRLETGEL